jgi:DNA-binding MarR family transcriptional regulator
MGTRDRNAGQDEADDGLTMVADAFVLASRVLVGVAVESIGARSDVSLAQFRLLVVLASGGRQNVVTLAEAVGVNPSTTTRLCDQLVRRKLVRRRSGTADRREVFIELTPLGAELVQEVLAHRRGRLAGILRRIPASVRSQLLPALQAFNVAAGEAPEQAWSVGWSRADSPATS